MTEFLQGFALGLAYVAPIGMQNLYVINAATRLPRKKAYTVALITILMDISLALCCFFGMGLLIESSQLVKKIILAIGSLVVIYIGISLVRSQAGEIDESVEVNLPIHKLVATCFSVTWLNPQALIDGSLLLGGFRASLPVGQEWFFIAGVCIASATWFLTLCTVTSTLKRFVTPKVLRIINIICGVIIIYFGVRLGLQFFGITL